MDCSSAVTLAMRNASMAALAALVDVAGVGARLDLYATARPAPNGAPGGVPMVAVLLAFPCGTVAAGALELADTDYAQIANSRTAVWARLHDAADTWICDFSVGTQAMHDADPLTAEVIVGVTTMYTGAFLALIGARIVSS